MLNNYSKNADTNTTRHQKRKANLDDGCNPELVKGADFDGYLGIPFIKKPKEFIIPTGISPFSCRNRIKDKYEAIGFFENDPVFADVLINPDKYDEEFKGRIIISLDCSLYRSSPLAVQITNTYRNRALGYHFQTVGAYVIPLIRWGNSLTYTTSVLPDKVAFLGVEKHSIVAVSTYGCCQTRDDKIEFSNGLKAMMETIEPEVVIVYGSMPDSIFAPYLTQARFIHFPDWTTRMHGGEK